MAGAALAVGQRPGTVARVPRDDHPARTPAMHALAPRRVIPPARERVITMRIVEQMSESSTVKGLVYLTSAGQPKG